jgi:hypothetical protein
MTDKHMQRLTSVSVPQARGAIVTASQYVIAIGGKCGIVDKGCMPDQLRWICHEIDVPASGAKIRAAGYERFAIGRKGDALDRFRMTTKDL